MNIFQNRFFVFLMVFSFLKPSGFDFLGFNALNQLLNLLRVIFALAILIKYFLTFKKFSAFLILEVLLFFSLYLSTIYNDEEWSTVSVFAISVIAFSALIELYIKLNFKLLVHILFFTYFLLISSNLVYMYNIIGLKVGSDELFASLDIVYNILASDNMVASYTFPALCIAFLKSTLGKTKFDLLSWVLYAMVLATSLMLWSATSIVGITLVLTYILAIYGNETLETYVSPRPLIIAGIFLMIGFTFLGFQNFFSFIIVDILQKDLTMTGRTNIWQIGMRGFDRSPLLGAGFNVMTIDSGMIQILYRGGLMSMVFFVALFYSATTRLYMFKRLAISKFFSFLLAIILIMSISESWSFFFGFFIILSIAYNIKEINDQLIKFKFEPSSKKRKKNALFQF